MKWQHHEIRENARASARFESKYGRRGVPSLQDQIARNEEAGRTNVRMTKALYRKLGLKLPKGY
jgi:hypothetical protein